MKYALIAGALMSAIIAAPAFADTAGPTQTEINTAVEAQIAPVSDQELRNFAAAQIELGEIYPEPAASQERLMTIRAETAAALARHNLNATRYNEIATAIDLNDNVAQRFASISPMRGAPGV